MKTLIVYATTHGCTRKYAEILASLLPGAILSELKTDPSPGLDAYDTVVVGGSIHAGMIQKSVRVFCEKNRDVLRQKKLGLFVSCMEEGEKARQQLEKAFPADLISGAAAVAHFGGAFDFDKMNFLERTIVRKVAKVSASVSKFDEAAVRDFARRLA
ncbi:MAG: flavodoxin domain-containing protein [Candidatus Aminicenantes bacterium]|nr:flavodoxin domain-containing protein [Candidatus Aminicenantes bacterium]